MQYNHTYYMTYRKVLIGILILSFVVATVVTNNVSTINTIVAKLISLLTSEESNIEK